MKFLSVKKDIFTKILTVFTLLFLPDLFDKTTFYYPNPNENFYLRRIRIPRESKTIGERFKSALSYVEDCNEVRNILSELDQKFRLSDSDEIEIPEEIVREIDYFVSARAKILADDELMRLLYAVYDILGLPNFNFTEKDYCESLWYKFLDSQGKVEMIRRLRNLRYTIITDSSGKSMSLFRYLIERVKEVAEEEFPSEKLADKIVIYTYGSYLYSPNPGDIDFRIYIKGSKLNVRSIYNSVVEVRLPRDEGSNLEIKAIGGGVVGTDSDLFSDRRFKGVLYYEGIKVFGNDEGRTPPDRSLVLLDVEHLIDLGDMNLRIIDSVRVNRGLQRLLTAGVVLSSLYPHEVPLEEVKRLFELNVESLNGNIEREKLKEKAEKFKDFLKDRMKLVKEKYHSEMDTQFYLKIVEELFTWTENKISSAPYEALHGIFRIYLWLDKALQRNYIDQATQIFKIIVDYVFQKRGKITEDLAKKHFERLKKDIEELKSVGLIEN
jgi:hypothetical protein